MKKLLVPIIVITLIIGGGAISYSYSRFRKPFRSEKPTLSYHVDIKKYR